MDKQCSFFKRNIVSLIFFCIFGFLLNAAGSFAASFFVLPVYLDTAGTVLVASLCGPIPAMLVGYASNVAMSFIAPSNMYYAVVNVLIALTAAIFAEKGFFRKAWKAAAASALIGLVAAVPSYIIGAAFQSTFYDADSQLAKYFETGFSMAGIPSGILAKTVTDICDKFICGMIAFIILRLLPMSFKRRFTYGQIYEKGQEKATVIMHHVLSREEMKAKRNEVSHSLYNRVALILTAFSVLLCVLTVSLSVILHIGTMDKRYTEIGKNAASFVADVVKGEEIDGFLNGGSNTQEYKDIARTLHEIKSNISAIEFLYIYKVEEDGCHVVFDVDTDEMKADSVGTVLPFDATLPAGDKEILLAGGEVRPFTSQDQYGWLLTVYVPVRDANGVTQAYTGVDISMEDVMQERYTFIIKILSLFSGVAIIIINIILWLAREYVTMPVNRMTVAMQDYAHRNSRERENGSAELRAIEIHTGDEIENLHTALVKTTNDVSQYLNVINLEMEENEEKTATIERMQQNTIISFANLVEERDENTGGHIHRTASYVKLIAEQMMKDGDYPETLDKGFVDRIVMSAPLHDIGKIKIPDAILNKPGRLSDEEYAIMKTHSAEGAKILEKILEGINEDNYLYYAINMAHWHHERWNGKGYPDGLSGTQIPLCARIMAIADVFDALVSARSYKEPFTFEQACGIIDSESGQQFDPLVVRAFDEVKGDMRKILQ